LTSRYVNERIPMPEEFKRGDRVEWKFRGRPVVGKVRRKLTKRTEIAGRPVAASKDDPRYVVRSEKSGKETTRRPTALRRLR
jgi:Hypervirulence associated proteins TUDOR domain